MQDSEVIAKSVADPDIFTNLFDKHFAAVHRYLHRRVGKVCADDLASEVFLQAFAKRARFDVSRTNALPWLYGIAHNVLRNQMRRSRRELNVIERLMFTNISTDHLDDIDDKVDARCLARDLAAALRELNDGDREVLLLATWEQLSYEDIAQSLQIPIGTVRSRLHRSRNLVRELFERSRQEELTAIHSETQSRKG